LVQVESGFPSPQVPSFDLVSELVWHGISIAIISFVIHIALAKLVSKKFHYEIDVNQVALQSRNINFFIQMIFFVTLVSVVLINVNTGLIIGIVFALLTVVFRTQWFDFLIALTFLRQTTYFEGLIVHAWDEYLVLLILKDLAIIVVLKKFLAVLACIILCAMKDLYIQLFRGFGLCRQSTVDFDGFYVIANLYVAGIKVFRFDAPLYFANAELFILSVHNACGLNPVLGCISDCSTIPYIDLMGKDAIAQTFADYATIDITVLIANCKVAVRQLFETSDFYQKVPKNRMFVSVNDAVTQALKEQRERVPERKQELHSQFIFLNQIDHTDGPRHVTKDPVALSPAQKTVVLNVLNEEGEEQITQSAGTVHCYSGNISKTHMKIKGRMEHVS
ncbi:STAS domain protein, partial [Ancylostoma duodenale]